MPRKTRELPDNADGLWRTYYGSKVYHHYDLNQLFSAWQHQVADCGRETRTGTGSFSPLRPSADFYQPVCGKCRAIVESRKEAAADG
jgi:hypothetical protein